VFLPQPMPDGFVKNTATWLLLRPREFLANARDLVTLKQKCGGSVTVEKSIKSVICPVRPS